ncbi:SRPBCC family protein [Antrihabitans cavernicola]|uniref:Polyketide cyclase n=1 Tax=Antrihabitans cavernicola TaxID=2495913 RepID=A0A5A7S6W8_9NOCA|nr:SRPBCC family protein [Spelaeibacter cavernicola]KAA0021626.1 polyketide cyclase [Spelaeibacter cavernicola]
MNARNVTHSSFTLERTYDAPPDRVFAAWSDAAAKSQWFAGPGFEYRLDFSVGGSEINRGHIDSGQLVSFEATIHDIVENERIVYSATLSADDVLSTVSLTTVELSSAGTGTTLVLTEHGSFLDDHEKPEWREQGTGEWLDALGAYVIKAS